jgi:hypothetical protein
MSGASDSRALGRIVEWKGQPNLTTWSGGICNVIEGTDATIFPPFWSRKDKVAIFLNDVCRYCVTVRLTRMVGHAERLVIRDGIIIIVII